jgi:alkylation response protein AidB-like acyl-CoA dehydrogenase
MSDLIGILTDFEEYLGDPYDPTSRLPYAKILDLDEREEYPHELIVHLRRWGLHEWVIPDACGGKAVNVEDAFNLIRLVSRRDATTGTAMMLTSLSYTPVWVAGTPEQKQYFADLLFNGGKMAWGLSERRHGSDILANELTAEKVDGGWVLNGEKWTIGNCTVADVVCLFTRTDPRGGPAGYSVFALEKRKVPAGQYAEIPNERIHGLRGLDMSGIRVENCFLPDSAMIGAPGKGLEIALKASQLARTTITCLTMGCTDTALRATLDFATTRKIFGGTVADIPYSRRQLVESFGDLLVSDALSLGAVRGLQANPAQTSIFSSVAKYFVPTILEKAVSQLGVVLGARYYLRTHPRYGVFQKMMRDLLVSNFADGNTVVNLKNIAGSLDKLLANADTLPDDLCERADESVAVLFDSSIPVPTYVPASQELFARGVDNVLLGLPTSIARLKEIAAGEGPLEAAWWSRAAELAEESAGEVRRMRAELAAITAAYGKGAPTSAEWYDLARQYCALFAAASVVHLWVFGRRSMTPELRSGAVLLSCLERTRQLRRPTERVTGRAEDDVVAEALLALHAGNRLFSVHPVQLATS